MSAQGLPYDIIIMIVAQLKLVLQPNPGTRIHAAKLAPYAGICKSWNWAIERETFQELLLDPGKLQYAETLLSSDTSRRSAVRRICFVSSCESSGSPKRDLSVRQLQARDRSFSKDLESLFRFLASVERREGEREGLGRLDLELEAGQDEIPPEGEDPESSEIDSDRGLSAYDSDDERVRYDPAHVRYVGDGLPQVRCVKMLYLHDERIWGGSITTIMSTMDGLELCDLGLNDKQTIDPGVRIGYRKALGESLSQIPLTCKEFIAGFEHYVVDDYTPQPGVVPPLDTLCIGLRALSTQLVRLSLDRLTISPTLLWPDDKEQSTAEPYWPRLEYLYVKYAQANAAGKWLGHWKPSKANPKRTYSIYIAAAKAIRNMPALLDMELDMNDEMPGDRSFTYQYKKDRNAFQAEWECYGKLQLSSDVLRAFGIGDEELGVSPSGCSGQAYIARS